MRKLQWRATPIRKSRLPPVRFGYTPSAKWPPPGLVPPRVLRLSRRILAILASVLSRTHECHTSTNLAPPEVSLLATLRDTEDLVIRPADKGGRWVVMNTPQYRAECQRQLNDDNFYRRLPELLSDTSSRISAILHDLLQRRFISKSEFLFLLPPDTPKPRCFSVLPKIHKPHQPGQMPPGRPIVADVKTNSSATAKFIEFFLNPLAKKLPSHVRDSFHLIALLRTARLRPTSLLVTLDVRALYTNVPIEEGLQRVRRAFIQHPDPNRPDTEILELLHLSLTANDFVFEEKAYLQTSGVAMGKAFGGSFCNLYMGEWESTALASASLRPSLWLRYQDDILCLWEHSIDALDAFTRHLNAQDNHIQVEMNSSPTTVRFLDLELFRDDCEIGYRIAFKPTDSHLLLPSSSHHPPHTHRGVLYSLLLRWATLSKKREDFQRTCATAFYSWRTQGVSRSLIRSSVNRVLDTTAFTTTWGPGFSKCNSSRCGACAFADARTAFTADGTLYPITHRLSCTTRGCVYVIHCSRCFATYIGQTGNTLRQRLSEHLRRVADPQAQTELYRHFRLHDASSLRVFAVEHCASEERRLLRESLWIRRFRSLAPEGLNSSPGSVTPKLNLVTYKAACTSSLNDAIRKACRAENFKVRLCYKADKNLKNSLF